MTTASTVVWVRLYKAERAERIRTESNQNALLKQKDERYKILLNEKDSISVLSTQQLVLTRNEFKENRDSLVNVIRAMNVKLRRVESVTNVNTSVDVGFDAPIKDSIIYINRTDTAYIDTIKCIKYEDAFNSFSACIQRDSLVNANMHVNVPITQIAHRIPKFKFLFIRLGTKHIKQEIFSENPSATIDYVEIIKLKK